MREFTDRLSEYVKASPYAMHKMFHTLKNKWPQINVKTNFYTTESYYPEVIIAPDPVARQLISSTEEIIEYVIPPKDNFVSFPIFHQWKKKDIRKKRVIKPFVVKYPAYITKQIEIITFGFDDGMERFWLTCGYWPMDDVLYIVKKS